MEDATARAGLLEGWCEETTEGPSGVAPDPHKPR